MLRRGGFGSLYRMTPHQRRRLRIRSAVAAGSVTVFLTLFGGISAQTSSGTDPALETQTQAVTRASDDTRPAVSTN